MTNKPQKSILKFKEKDFLNHIYNDLNKYGSVKIVGLGIFYLRKIPSRMGYNPKKREKKVVPAYTKIKFRVSKTFKSKIIDKQWAVDNS